MSRHRDLARQASRRLLSVFSLAESLAFDDNGVCRVCGAQDWPHKDRCALQSERQKVCVLRDNIQGRKPSNKKSAQGAQGT